MTSKSDSIDEMILKVELGNEIARIALDCPSCRGTIKELIQRRQHFSNNDHVGGSQ